MLKRLPEIHNIVPVFAVIVAVVYGWSIFAFFWKTPSWLFFLQINEIFVIVAYTLTVNFLGSLLFLGFLLFFCLILPSQYFKDNFIVQGGLVSLFVLGSVALYINRYSEYNIDFLKYLPIWSFITVVAVVFTSFFAPKVLFIRQGILWIADRLVIFLYILIPLSVFSLVVVVFRNIL